MKKIFDNLGRILGLGLGVFGIFYVAGKEWAIEPLVWSFLLCCGYKFIKSLIEDFGKKSKDEN